MTGETGYPKNEQMEKMFHKAFELTNKEVYKAVSDVRFSGSTCVSILTYGRRVYVANVGDSRAILIK